MKIVHFSASLNRSSGGLPHSAAGLAAAQRAAGAQVEVHGRMAGFDEAERRIWGDTPLVVQPAPRDVTYALDARLIRGVLEARPDILHIHGIWSGSTITGLIGQLRGIATVVAPHGMLEPYTLRRSPLKKAVHSFLFERPLLRRAAIHALSAQEEASVRAFMAPQAVRVFTVPNGVDLLPPRDLGQRTGALYLGRLHEKKQAVELVRHWRAEPALATVPLTVAGTGEDDYVRRVMAEAEGATNVRFFGPAYGEDKRRLLADARYFVLPSQSEGMPMAILEAIAAGCVPAITPECNMRFLFERSCALPMASDFADFPEVARHMAAMPEPEFARRAKAGFAAARDYSWEKVAADLFGHYQALLSAR